MSLVCCLAIEPGCICDVVKPCGGIHFINAGCTVHRKVQVKSTIHEIGARPIATVELASGDGGLSPSL